MIRSMTGFGRFESENELVRLTVEMKSVNHRYCDISIRLPKILNAYENSIRKLIKERASRGKIDVYISYENIQQSDAMISYNRELATAYMNLISSISSDFKLENKLDAVTLSRYPEVFKLEEPSFEEDELEKIVMDTVNGTLDRFVESREKEGEELRKDLLLKLDRISDIVEKIEKRSPEVFDEYKNRLTKKVTEVLENTELDDSVLATELVIYSDKICVDEEMVRLKSHVKNMKEALEQEESVGRKLDFITQELNREANTTLSKANDMIIADLGIMLKTEIEKIREQVQNLE